MTIEVGQQVYFDDVEITLLGSFVSIEVLKNHPKATEVIVLDKKYKSLYKIYNRLGVFDVYFTFRSSFRAKLLRFFVKSKNNYQFDVIIMADVIEHFDNPFETMSLIEKNDLKSSASSLENISRPGLRDRLATLG